MKELIKIKNENGKNLVSGRDLHEGLKVQQDFTDWIKKQLENVDAIEDEEFSLLKGKTSELGGRPSTDYIITTDIAKEICMVVGVSPRTNENTRKLSKQFRRYFIECEKQLQEVNNKANLLLQIYNGGQEGIAAAKKLNELEVKEATKPLLEGIKHKEEVITDLTSGVELATLQQRINDIVKYGNGAKRNADYFSKRYKLLYEEFNKKYHMNVKTRIENARAKKLVTAKTTVMEYICNVLEMTPQLYELACTLFEVEANAVKNKLLISIER